MVLFQAETLQRLQDTERGLEERRKELEEEKAKLVSNFHLAF